MSTPEDGAHPHSESSASSVGGIDERLERRRAKESKRKHNRQHRNRSPSQTRLGDSLTRRQRASSNASLNSGCYKGAGLRSALPVGGVETLSDTASDVGPPKPRNPGPQFHRKREEIPALSCCESGATPVADEEQSQEEEHEEPVVEKPQEEQEEAAEEATAEPEQEKPHEEQEEAAAEPEQEEPQEEQEEAAEEAAAEPEQEKPQEEQEEAAEEATAEPEQEKPHEEQEEAAAEPEQEQPQEEQEEAAEEAAAEPEQEKPHEEQEEAAAEPEQEQPQEEQEEAAEEAAAEPEQEKPHEEQEEAAAEPEQEQPQEEQEEAAEEATAEPEQEKPHEEQEEAAAEPEQEQPQEEQEEAAEEAAAEPEQEQPQEEQEEAAEEATAEPEQKKSRDATPPAHRSGTNLDATASSVLTGSEAPGTCSHGPHYGVFRNDDGPCYVAQRHYCEHCCICEQNLHSNMATMNPEIISAHPPVICERASPFQRSVRFSDAESEVGPEEPFVMARDGQPISATLKCASRTNMEEDDGMEPMEPEMGKEHMEVVESNPTRIVGAGEDEHKCDCSCTYCWSNHHSHADIRPQARPPLHPTKPATAVGDLIVQQRRPSRPMSGSASHSSHILTHHGALEEVTSSRASPRAEDRRVGSGSERTLTASTRNSDGLGSSFNSSLASVEHARERSRLLPHGPTSDHASSRHAGLEEIKEASGSFTASERSRDEEPAEERAVAKEKAKSEEEEEEAAELEKANPQERPMTAGSGRSSTARSQNAALEECPSARSSVPASPRKEEEEVREQAAIEEAKEAKEEAAEEAKEEAAEEAKEKAAEEAQEEAAEVAKEEAKEEEAADEEHDVDQLDKRSRPMSMGSQSPQLCSQVITLQEEEAAEEAKEEEAEVHRGEGKERPLSASQRTGTAVSSRHAADAVSPALDEEAKEEAAEEAKEEAAEEAKEEAAEEAKEEAKEEEAEVHRGEGKERPLSASQRTGTAVSSRHAADAVSPALDEEAKEEAAEEAKEEAADEEHDVDQLDKRSRPMSMGSQSPQLCSQVITLQEEEAAEEAKEEAAEEAKEEAAEEAKEEAAEEAKEEAAEEAKEEAAEEAKEEAKEEEAEVHRGEGKERPLSASQRTGTAVSSRHAADAVSPALAAEDDEDAPVSETTRQAEQCRPLSGSMKSTSVNSYRAYGQEQASTTSEPIEEAKDDAMVTDATEEAKEEEVAEEKEEAAEEKEEAAEEKEEAAEEKEEAAEEKEEAAEEKEEAAEEKEEAAEEKEEAAEEKEEAAEEKEEAAEEKEEAAEEKEEAAEEKEEAAEEKEEAAEEKEEAAEEAKEEAAVEAKEEPVAKPKKLKKKKAAAEKPEEVVEEAPAPAAAEKPKKIKKKKAPAPVEEEAKPVEPVEAAAPPPPPKEKKKKRQEPAKPSVEHVDKASQTAPMKEKKKDDSKKEKEKEEVQYVRHALCGMPATRIEDGQWVCDSSACRVCFPVVEPTKPAGKRSGSKRTKLPPIDQKRKRAAGASRPAPAQPVGSAAYRPLIAYRALAGGAGDLDHTYRYCDMKTGKMMLHRKGRAKDECLDDYNKEEDDEEETPCLEWKQQQQQQHGRRQHGEDDVKSWEDASEGEAPYQDPADYSDDEEAQDIPNYDAMNDKAQKAASRSNKKKSSRLPPLVSHSTDPDVLVYNGRRYYHPKTLKEQKQKSEEQEQQQNSANAPRAPSKTSRPGSKRQAAKSGRADLVY